MPKIIKYNVKYGSSIQEKAETNRVVSKKNVWIRAMLVIKSTQSDDKNM